LIGLIEKLHTKLPQTLIHWVSSSFDHSMGLCDTKLFCLTF
jgi:hypothetical protein